MTASDDRRPGESFPTKPLGADEARAVLSHAAQATRAKLQLGPGLRAMAEETGVGRTREALLAWADRLDQGEPIGSVTEEMTAGVSPTLQVLLQHGSSLGRLDEVLQWAMEQWRRSLDLHRSLCLALSYPLFLFIASLGVCGALVFTVVPQFRKIFEDFGTELPGITVMVIGVARYGLGIWAITMVVLICLLMASIVMGTMFGERLARIPGIHHVPVIGPLLRNSALAELCDLLALLIDGGMTLEDALSACGDSLSNTSMRAACRSIVKDLVLGESAEMAARAARLPAGLCYVLRDGQSTESLGETLRGLAETYAARVEVGMRTLTTVIEPFVIAMVAGVIGLVVISLFMPLIKLLNDLS